MSSDRASPGGLTRRLLQERERRARRPMQAAAPGTLPAAASLGAPARHLARGAYPAALPEELSLVGSDRHLARSLARNSARETFPDKAARYSAARDTVGRMAARDVAARQAAARDAQTRQGRHGARWLARKPTRDPAWCPTQPSRAWSLRWQPLRTGRKRATLEWLWARGGKAHRRLADGGNLCLLTRGCRREKKSEFWLRPAAKRGAQLVCAPRQVHSLQHPTLCCLPAKAGAC